MNSAPAQSFEANRERFMSELSEFLAFKSISTDPAFAEDCARCADWLRKHLQKIGFKAEVIATEGRPLVYAERAGRAGSPVVLYYGHYDVQPVDPLDLWRSDPFRAELRDGRLYARGAQDNKGQTFYVLKALETLIADKSLTNTVKIILEGEEESGSPSIKVKLAELRNKLAADVLMVCDTGTVDANFSAITMGLRGIASFEFRLQGPKYDLHSGVHGGMVRNPAIEMARLLATLHENDGRIAIAGYYDGVPEIDPADRALCNAMPLKLEDYEAQIGAPAAGGELRFTPLERRGFRPTVEVNGLVSGYTGAGGKTIIPSHATAKISLRTVAGQDPARCMQLAIDHLRSRTPIGLRFELVASGVGGAALRLSSKLPLVQRAKSVLDRVTPAGTIFIWEGASIPIVADLAEAAGAEPLIVGFGLEEDSIHAPNESFAIEQFRKGYVYVSELLADLGKS